MKTLVSCLFSLAIINSVVGQYFNAPYGYAGYGYGPYAQRFYPLGYRFFPGRYGFFPGGDGFLSGGNGFFPLLFGLLQGGLGSFNFFNSNPIENALKGAAFGVLAALLNL